MSSGTQPNKDAGSPAHDSDEQFPNKAAIIRLSDGRLLEVHHRFIDKHDRVCVYFDSRQSGIDAKFYNDNVEILFESPSAAVHAFGMTVKELHEEVENSW